MLGKVLKGLFQINIFLKEVNNVVTLDPKVEQEIMSSIKQTEQGTIYPLIQK